MYRFLLRPKWLAFHLLIAVLVVTMVNLALWQLRRLDERQAFNAQVAANQDATPKPVEELLPPNTDTAATATGALQWYPVTASGTYLADQAVLVVNISQDGSPGVDSVVPLQLDDGRLLIVNRGFVAEGDTVPDPPEGTVSIVGRLRPSQKRGTGQLSDPAEGTLTEIHRVDLNRLQMQLPAPVVAMYVDLLASEPAEPAGQIAMVAAPKLDNGPHLSYAVQWFIFTIAALVGWVLAVRRSARRHGSDAES
jgi:cytochrome oxidase assembly protein ShyY1